MENMNCKNCGSNDITESLVNKHGSFSVALGYFLFVISIICVILSIVTGIWASILYGATQGEARYNTLASDLRGLGAPTELINKIVEEKPITDQDYAGIDEYTEKKIREKIDSHEFGMSIADGTFVFFVGCSVVGIVMAVVWFFVSRFLRKKITVLVCNSCGTIQ